MLKTILLSLFLLVISGCSTTALVHTEHRLPTAKAKHQISLFELKNYTDTPRAGMRATNLIEGIFLAHHYNIISHFDTKTYSLQAARQQAQKDGSDYFLIGGLSEWRYKTGIDGEPAVSLQLSMYSTQDLKVTWSATGSQNDWGNSSLGNTAQTLLESMMAQ